MFILGCDKYRFSASYTLCNQRFNLNHYAHLGKILSEISHNLVLRPCLTPSRRFATLARMIWKPHATVAAVLEQDGRYLLVEERISGELRLNQPAGHLEEGESLIEAAVRETIEEAGLVFRPTHLVGIYQWRAPETGATYLRVAFSGEIERMIESAVLDEGILGPVWLSPDEVRARASQHRSPLVMDCIEDHRAGRRFPLELIRHYPL